MKRAMRVGGDDAGKEWKAAPGTMDDGQKICPFPAKKQCTDGRSLFLYAQGHCHYVHTGNFGRIVKEGAKRREGAKAIITGKCPNEEDGGGMGRKKQRNEYEYGLRQLTGPTKEGVRTRAVREMDGDGQPRREGGSW